MTGGLVSAYILPHDFRNPQQSPSPSYFPQSTSTMTSRKRKASDDDILDYNPDRMSSSPSPSPAILPGSNGSQSTPRSLPPTPSRTHHFTKRPRTNTSGRPLPLPRLLETLSADEMRSLLRQLCDRNPSIAAEITSSAPRPSVSSALGVLTHYQSALRSSFPYGDRPTSEYSFNRVRPSLLALLDALRDYVPQFLPPNEAQVATSLAFLDGVTNIVHALPNWESYIHDRHKSEAYEEMAAAWALVIREAAKRGGGIQLQVGGWDQKVLKHNEISGGKMGEAVEALRANCGWIGGGSGGAGGGSGLGGANGIGYGGQQDIDEQRMGLRQQILAGTYGMNNNPIQVGNRW